MGVKITWDEWYKLAEAYYNHHGNLNVKQSFNTSNGYEYDETGYRLGIWLGNQRSKYNAEALTEEQKKKLELLGANFGNTQDVRWEMMYELAKVYYEHYGNLEIKISFRTKNGYEYDESGYKLGAWLSQQRWQHRHHTLFVDRTQKLEAIGLGYESLYEKDWNRMYALAVTYYQHHHNLNVDVKFKTKNGYEYDSEGETLGSWIVTQRMAHKNKKLSSERIAKLQLIEMRFFINKNKAANQVACIRYGIDYETYSQTINIIPYKEFISKINYLRSLNIPLTINGQLHPIFTMSNINMQIRYGISLENLINEYSNAKTKKLKGDLK